MSLNSANPLSDTANTGHLPASKADLFFSFSMLALQGFGGVLAVVQRELVEKKRWLTREEFLEDWAVAQILPGPNVVNLSLMIGDRYFGFAGALAAPLQQWRADAVPRLDGLASHCRADRRHTCFYLDVQRLAVAQSR